MCLILSTQCKCYVCAPTFYLTHFISLIGMYFTLMYLIGMSCTPVFNRYVLHTYVSIGIKRANLRFLEEHRVYSLSKKGTSTMLFVLQYEQNINNKLMERPLEFLVSRFAPHPRLICTIPRCSPNRRCLIYQTTTVHSVYHILS